MDKDHYNKFILKKFEEKEISQKMKIEKVIVNRLFNIFKFLLTLKNQENKKIFKEDMFNILKNTDGATFDLKKFMKNRKPYAPFISFHDDEEFKFNLEELSSVFKPQSKDFFAFFFIFFF